MKIDEIIRMDNQPERLIVKFILNLVRLTWLNKRLLKQANEIASYWIGQMLNKLKDNWRQPWMNVMND